MARIDVIVPCYRYGRYLPTCVGSILDQRGVDVRVLVIDDASDDDSFAVAESLAAADGAAGRVEVRRHAVNQGHIATYNEGLEWATGDAVVLISADDLLAPGALARAAAVLDRHPSVGFVYGWSPTFVTDDEIDATAGDRRQLATKVWMGRTWVGGRCRSGRNVVTSPEVVVRTSIHHAVGGYDATLPHSGDLELWLRLASRADVAHIRGPAQAWHRVHAKSMLQSQYADPLLDLRQRRAAFDAWYDKVAGQFPGAGWHHRSARRALAREAVRRASWAYDRGRVDATPVAALVEFALETDPRATTSLEWYGWAARQRLGPDVCHRAKPFLATTVSRRLRDELWWRSWRWRGV